MVQDDEAGVDAEGEGDGVFVFAGGFGFLDDGGALELGEAEVRDGVAEGGFIGALVQRGGVAVPVVRGRRHFRGDAVHVAIDRDREEGGGF